MRFPSISALLAVTLYASTVYANQAPVPNAGEDRTVVADENCTAIVVLDGSLSTDADGTTGLIYEWTGPFGKGGALQTILGVKVSATLPIGANYEFILKVTDPAGASATDTVLISVADETAPELTVSASPNSLWPPNHKMIPIAITAVSTDGCGEITATPKIVLVESNEPDDGTGDGNFSPDWEITGDLTLNLRAERSGNGTGRTYTITLESTDAAGNTGTATVTVKVPHDMGKGDDDDDDDDEQAEFRTYTQEDWSDHETAVAYLDEHFVDAFPNGLKIGAGPSGLSGNSATFTTPEAIKAFLPATGTMAPLATEFIDPLETTGGELAGHAVALTLNIEFDARDRKFGSSKTLLKDIVIVDEASPVYGKTVYEILQMANAYLGGGATLLDGPALAETLKAINESYRNAEECEQYVKPPCELLSDDDCKGAKTALKDKKGKIYEKLCRLFDDDDDGEVKGKEKRRLSKSVSEFNRSQKDKAKKDKKKTAKGGRKDNDD